MTTIETPFAGFNPDAVAHAKRISNWAFGGLTVVLALSGAEPQAILTGVSWFLFNRALSVKPRADNLTIKKRNPIKSAAVMTGLAAFLIVCIVLKMGPILGLLAAWGAGVGMSRLLRSPTFNAAQSTELQVPPAAPVANPVPPAISTQQASAAAPAEPAIIIAARAEVERLLAAAGKLNEAETFTRLTAVAVSLNATLDAIAQDEEKTASARTLLSVHLPAAADLTEDFASAPPSARTTELRERFKQLIGSLSERADALHERFVGREARKLDVKMEVLKKRLEEDY